MEVGQKIYLIPTQFSSRKDSEIQEYIITSVGRKYFEACREDTPNQFPLKFDKDTLRQVTKYSPDWEVYFDKQEILDMREAKDLCDTIREAIGRYDIPDISLDKLRRIKSIIEEGK